MPKLKPHEVYFQMSILVNLKVLNTNLTGFSFSQKLVSILGSFELINIYLPEIIEKPHKFKGKCNN